MMSNIKTRSFPVLCKNGLWAESSTGRKIISEEAARGKVEYLRESMDYVNQRLKITLIADCVEISNGTLNYHIFQAEKINKHGLKWEEQLFWQRNLLKRLYFTIVNIMK